MAKKSYETVILEVGAEIERAIHENRRQEWIIIILLIALFVTGLGLIT